MDYRPRVYIFSPTPQPPPPPFSTIPTSVPPPPVTPPQTSNSLNQVKKKRRIYFGIFLTKGFMGFVFVLIFEI